MRLEDLNPDGTIKDADRFPRVTNLDLNTGIAANWGDFDYCFLIPRNINNTSPFSIIMLHPEYEYGSEEFWVCYCPNVLKGQYVSDSYDGCKWIYNKTPGSTEVTFGNFNIGWNIQNIIPKDLTFEQVLAAGDYVMAAPAVLGVTGLCDYMDADDYSSWQPELNVIDKYYFAVTESTFSELYIKKDTWEKLIVADENVHYEKIKWTGHADAEGLRAIGWTDEDIAYYQEHGVNWHSEFDAHHKVTEDNKALYGVLTVDNIMEYPHILVYLPKIDTSNVTDMGGMFWGCDLLTAIPELDTSNVTNMSEMFGNCYSLISIPKLNTSNVTNMDNMFECCNSLVSIPELDTSNVTSMGNMFLNCTRLTSIPQLNTSNVEWMGSMFLGCSSLISIPELDTSKVEGMCGMFSGCSSLVSIPMLDTSNVTDTNKMFEHCSSLVLVPKLNTSNVTNMQLMFAGCCSLVSAPDLDTSKATLMYHMFNGCGSLVSINNLSTYSNTQGLDTIFEWCSALNYVHLKDLNKSLNLAQSSQLGQGSLSYIINNANRSVSITITLHPYAYERLASDQDIITLLSNHRNISLAKYEE